MSRPANFGLEDTATSGWEVIIARDGARLYEFFDDGVRVATLKAFVPTEVWAFIADPVKASFNERLRKHQHRSGRWSKTTVLDRTLGKELCLLAWAIEDAPPELRERVLKNWQGFHPEERWWLFTTTNATSNLPTFGKDRGWRKAIRIAFTEN